MTGNFTSNNCRLVGAHLNTAAETTVFRAEKWNQVIGIRLANVTSSDVTATVSWYSKSAADQYRLAFEYTIPANDFRLFQLDAFQPEDGDEIRVKAGAAGALDVILAIVEIPSRNW